MLAALGFIVGAFGCMALCVAALAATKRQPGFTLSRAEVALRVMVAAAAVAYVVTAGVVMGEPMGMLCMFITTPGILALAESLD